MRAYILNLDKAQDRWAFAEKAFASTGFELVRISAVDGNALEFPIPDYSEKLYHRHHGRPTNPRHVGCYLSHVKALRAFLETTDEHALIAEDDLVLGPDFEAVVASALTFSKHWNILKLTGLSNGQPARTAPLVGGYHLCVGFGRLKGTGAYIIDRKGAAAWVTDLLPMSLPIDHALDREWFSGLSAVYIQPFPASQSDSGFRSSIQVGKSLKLSQWRRYLTVYPYQVMNETARILFRSFSYCQWKLATSK